MFGSRKAFGSGPASFHGRSGQRLDVVEVALRISGGIVGGAAAERNVMARREITIAIIFVAVGVVAKSLGAMLIECCAEA